MADLDLKVDEWGAAHGGLRGSLLLRAGALLAIVSLLVETGSRLFVPDLDTGLWGVTVGAWLGWIAALAILGLGFLWTGLNPVLTRFGLVVGAFHVLHAAFLLMRIFTEFSWPVPPRALAAGRLVLVMAFAFQERSFLGPRGSRLLLATAALVLAKALAAAWHLPSDLGTVGSALWDFIPSSCLGLALYHTGTLVKYREDAWAKTYLAQQGTGFEDYDNPLNPQHRSDT